MPPPPVLRVRLRSTGCFFVLPSTEAIPSCDLSSLPPEASDTLDLIHSGGSFPYDQDGTVFQNREGIVPSVATGYYHEYTVKTPGSPDQGARRLIGGGATTSPSTSTTPTTTTRPSARWTSSPEMIPR